ncbi:MAG: NUDIX hydrolase [Nitrospirota bacterium]|nr:NUDIX hydrolase [Nitrospirota bacterium]
MKASTDRRNPVPTVDTIIQYNDGIVLIKRKHPPEGWALPGGFVEYGETLEDSAVREAREETGLDVTLIRQFHSYSDPGRDARMHTVSTVFIAAASGEAEAGDDAAEVAVFNRDNLPGEIAFDHRKILDDYFSGRY